MSGGNQWFFGILIVCMVAWYVWRSNGDGLDSSQIKEMIDSGALLVDVRTPAEYAGEHVDGAINIPLGTLQDRLNEFGPKDGAIAVYCRSGQRSGSAKGILESQGYKSVVNLGGIGTVQRALSPKN